MDKAFLVGSDENQIDILFWWLDLRKKYAPDIPVQIVNFGINESTIQRLKYLGYIILELPEKLNNKKTWFNKPKAMMLSKANITLWMDIDTEFVKDPTDIFDLAQDNKLGLVDDQYYRSKFKLMYNSGVVLYKGIPELLKKWDKAINTSKERGDQEVLYELLHNDVKLNNQIFKLDDKYNYVRLMYKTYPSLVEDLRVIHWTGPQGKNIIRSSKKMGLLDIEKGTTKLGHDFNGDENQYNPNKED